MSSTEVGAFSLQPAGLPKLLLGTSNPAAIAFWIVVKAKVDARKNAHNIHKKLDFFTWIPFSMRETKNPEEVLVLRGWGTKLICFAFTERLLTKTIELRHFRPTDNSMPVG